MTSLSEAIEKFKAKVEIQLNEVQPKAMRKALNAAAKELEATVKPLVPVLGKSTDFRQKGTVKKNIRHKTKIARDKQSGITIVRVRRSKGQKMAKVSDNTRDRSDPFYWFMLDRGTKKMAGQHFMERAWNAGRDKAIARAKAVFEEEMIKNSK